MATPVPKNVAAALGLVPTVLGGVRRLPAKAVQLPVIAVGSALAGIDAAKREYDELAERGERLIGRLRGGAAQNGATYGKAEDAVQGVAMAQGVSVATGVSVTPDVSTAPQPVRVDSAASAEVIERVEAIAQNIDAPLITDHGALPLPDYDHMTLGSLRGRLRSLDLQQLVQLRDYEKSKADRLPVVTMLDNRIAKLSSGESAPTGTPDAAPVTSPTRPPKTVDSTVPSATSGAPAHTKVRST
jgi:hypothetical protein